MRLTDEKITDIKEYLNRSIKVTASSLIPQLSKYGIDLIDTIEALRQENEQLQAQLDEWKYEVKCHMDEVVARDKEIEKLRAQVARMRETLIFTKEKIYEQLSNYVNDPKKFKYSAISIECVQKIVRALADASDYHNPADVEALRKAKEEIQKSLKNYELVGEHEYDISEHLQIALAEIDKVIGGLSHEEDKV